jgi:hypothetical protein
MMTAKAGRSVAVIVMALALAGVSAIPVAMAAESRAPAEGSDRYGSPAGDMPYDVEIRLGPGTRAVSVARNETIKFVTADGREFRWRFDTLAPFEVFPLAHIAPANFAVPSGVNVHVTGDIPIAP